MAQAPDDPAPCDIVASHTIKLSPVDDKQVFIEIVERHCREDLWSADARKCYLAALTFEEGIPCGNKLTATQQQALADDAAAHGAHVAVPPRQQ